MCARRVESSVVRRDLHMYLGAQMAATQLELKGEPTEVLIILT